MEKHAGLNMIAFWCGGVQVLGGGRSAQAPRIQGATDRGREDVKQELAQGGPRRNHFLNREFTRMDAAGPVAATEEMITTKGTKGTKGTKERSWRRIDIHAKAQRRQGIGVGFMRF